MSVEQTLRERSASTCELCTSPDGLMVYEVPPVGNGGVDASILVCSTCHAQIENAADMDVHHWRCLNDSMWSTLPAVQVVAWRMLTRLRAEGWPQDLLDMLYLDEETMVWARATGEGESEAETIRHLDSNGVLLLDGDTVTLIKDLNVKGGGFTAKRGTAVRGISLDRDNPEHIEGRVSGQQIVLLTKYVKKSS
jgi:protein PhnA